MKRMNFTYNSNFFCSLWCDKIQRWYFGVKKLIENERIFLRVLRRPPDFFYLQFQFLTWHFRICMSENINDLLIKSAPWIKTLQTSTRVFQIRISEFTLIIFCSKYGGYQKNEDWCNFEYVQRCISERKNIFKFSKVWVHWKHHSPIIVGV